LKPNIIFFFVDQQRWDTVGCYGHAPVSSLTPNLDRMAAEGTRFEFAFTPQPVCGPARACIQTGKYATQTGCWRNGLGLPAKETTIAHRLSKAGYEVGYLGKWHLGMIGDLNLDDAPVPPRRRGGYKDYWLASDVLEFTSHGYDGHLYDSKMKRVDFKGYRADCQTDFALDYLRTRDRKKPFFLMVSYIEPHQQNDRDCFEGPKGSKQKYARYKVPLDLRGKKGDWEKNFPDYLGQVHSIDFNLGRLRTELKRLGMDKDTVILYASDHGCHFHTRRGEYKRTCHEAALRIPLLACGPGFKGGQVRKKLASLLDIPATILKAAGVKTPKEMKGRPLQDMGRGPWREAAFAQISESQVGRCLRTDRWKYSVSAPWLNGWDDPASELYLEEFLYDLKADPHEQKNLVLEPKLAKVRLQLAGMLKKAMKEAGEKEARILPHPVQGPDWMKAAGEL
jgi:uncharacterized sulfatase